MGSQRVATSVTDLASQLSSTGSGSEFGGPANQSNASDPVIQDFEATMTCLYGNQVSFGFDPALDLPLMDEVAFVDCNEGVVVDPNQIVAEDPECACEQSTYWASQYEADCPSYNIMYWYHPDYLGSVEAVTDIDGEVYQFFHNTIWGEDIVSQKSYLYNHYSSPYRFNGKEKDWETGNHYYGARYYDPKLSVWLSVDPLASKFHNLSPYNFVENNPLMMIDPDGRGPWIYDQLEDGTYQRRKVEENDGGENFHTYHNNDGTTSYYDQKAGTFVTVNNSETKQKLANYIATVARRREAVKKTREVINNIGDGIATVGYVAAPFTEGASLTLSAVGEGISLTGKAITNAANFEESGATTENMVDLGVDVLIELAPLPLENVVKKSNLDDVSKKIIRSEIGKVKQTGEYVIKKEIEENRSNGN